MIINYKKLLKLLIDNNMNKKDLKEKAGVGADSLVKPVKGENITNVVLLKTSDAMDCDIADIMEIDKYVENQQQHKKLIVWRQR